MIDERRCYKFIGFYSSKSSCIATVIRSILFNHSTKQQHPTSKNQNFCKLTTTLARFCTLRTCTFRTATMFGRQTQKPEECCLENVCKYEERYHPHPTPPHPNPSHPTKNIMWRSIDHVCKCKKHPVLCKCKERYHPHPTPTHETGANPPSIQNVAYSFQINRCFQFWRDFFKALGCALTKALALIGMRFKGENDWQGNRYLVNILYCYLYKPLCRKKCNVLKWSKLWICT